MRSQPKLYMVEGYSMQLETNQSIHSELKRRCGIGCVNYMTYSRVIVLCIAVLHYVVACGALFCVHPMKGLNCVISSVYLVFCVQHIMAMESLFPCLKPMARKSNGVVELSKCYCYLAFELMFFLFHCVVFVIFLCSHLQLATCLLFVIHLAVHCIMSYVSMMRILETCRFMFCDIKR